MIMADKNNTNIPQKPIETDRISISNKGSDKQNNNYLDINELVRSIQRAENNVDCFRKEGHHNCNQTDCAWREYCMEKTESKVY